jgi:hypothetical protein
MDGKAALYSIDELFVGTQSLLTIKQLINQ